jgi:hypothetical protein
MNLTTILAQKITDTNPAVDIHGSDRKVLQIASQDFRNYFKFNQKIPEDASDNDVEDTIEQTLRNEPVEFDSFLTVWVGIWLNKWKARVKLLFGNQNQNKHSEKQKPTMDVEAVWAKLECKNEMKAIVVSALIRNAEICGTDILAENLLKKELSKLSSQELNEKQIVSILNNALGKAREMTQRVGPLIYVKVDQNYYGQ